MTTLMKVTFCAMSALQKNLLYYALTNGRYLHKYCAQKIMLLQKAIYRHRIKKKDQIQIATLTLLYQGILKSIIKMQ